MQVLLDTNILLRASQEGHPHHFDAVAAIEALLKGGRSVCVSSQSCYEYLAVATRSLTANGLALSQSAAVAKLKSLLVDVDVLFDTPPVLDELQ